MDNNASALPDELAAHVVEQCLNLENPKQVHELIRQAIVRACNDEVEKRRALEAQLKNMQAGGPMIVCAEKSVTLRVWNPKTKCWWETSLIKVGGWDG